ncbi:uncharacterized protein METZ01_LOCUS491407, partial [marine metagenome]
MLVFFNTFGLLHHQSGLVEPPFLQFQDSIEYLLVGDAA